MKLRSSRIVTPVGTIAGELLISDTRIAAIGALSSAPLGGDIVELGDRWVVPGYIDLHVHGGAGAHFNTDDVEEILAAARFHAVHGTTSLLATTLPAPVPQLEAALAAIAQCIDGDRHAAARGPGRSGRRGASKVLGAHLEGPFLNGQRPGALDPSLFAAPDTGTWSRLHEAGRGALRLMTLAPELPGALPLIDSMVSVGVVASLGHSEADYAVTEAAVAAGARAATHVFNGMAPMHHRNPGILGAVLDLPEVSCELICDGIHVGPAAVRLAYRAKGAAQIRLATDATQAAGMRDGEYRLGEAPVVVRNGQATLAAGGALAGSTLTMDAAVRNAVRFLDISLEQAARLASANPARLLGLADRKGALAPGLDADLVVLDDELRVCATLIAGEWIGEAPAPAR